MFIIFDAAPILLLILALIISALSGASDAIHSVLVIFQKHTVLLLFLSTILAFWMSLLQNASIRETRKLSWLIVHSLVDTTLFIPLFILIFVDATLNYSTGWHAIIDAILLISGIFVTAMLYYGLAWIYIVIKKIIITETNKELLGEALSIIFSIIFCCTFWFLFSMMLRSLYEASEIEQIQNNFSPFINWIMKIIVGY